MARHPFICEDTMFKLKYHIPLTAAALLALAATASAETPSTEAANAQASTSPAAAAAQANDPNGAAQQADAAEPVSGMETAATGESAAPITNDSVRGDVVLSMLDQQSCERMDQASGPDAKGSTDAGYPSVSATNRIDPDNYQKISGFPIGDRTAPCNPSFFRYDALGAGDYTVTEHEGLERVRHSYLGETVDKHFNGLTGSVALHVNANGFSLGDTADIKTTALGSDGLAKEAKLQFTSTKPFTTTFTARVPYDVLSVWKDGTGRNYQLMLLRGHQGQAKLCWNTNTDQVKRLSCTTWTAPQNWKRGDRLNIVGQYIIDDRTTYGEQGLIYFSNK